jgi:hypothetical protein
MPNRVIAQPTLGIGWELEKGQCIRSVRQAFLLPKLCLIYPSLRLVVSSRREHMPRQLAACQPAPFMLSRLHFCTRCWQFLLSPADQRQL